MKSAIGTPVVVDTDADIRWVATGPDNSTSSRFENNGFLIGSATAPTLTRLELDGSSTQTTLSDGAYIDFNHNIDPGKSGLLVEVNATNGGVASVESTVAEIDPTALVLRQWDLASVIGNYMLGQGDDPSSFVRPGLDWFHSNGSTYDASDDSVIVSSRENFLIKLDYLTGDIVWIFGDPTKYWYTFPSLRAKALTLDAGGLYPIGQHAPSITSDGLLMVFNNGGPSFNQPAGAPAGDSRTYSAVSAYSIDATTATAHEAWRFDYGQTILSDICSSAYEASGQSILISYATADQRTTARLVGLDANHQVVFHFEYASPQACGTSWNAVPVPFDDLHFD